MAEDKANIAVLVGISDYDNLDELAACSIDAKTVESVIRATEKYAHVTCFSGRRTAVELRAAMRSFFSDHKDAVNEALFYFSGHGTVSGDTALLCCSDYDEEKPNSTALSNDEIDDLIRQSGAALAVKVIDACSSGVPYIKAAESTFEKAFRKKGNALKEFWFMASSHPEQSSYASDTMSAFTRHFVDGALGAPTGPEPVRPILYRDIQSHVADSFAGDKQQQPFFVHQGSGLEEFALITDAMAKLASDLVKVEEEGEEPEDSTNTIRRHVQDNDEKYISMDAVEKALAHAKTGISTAKISDPLVAELFSTSCDFSQHLPFVAGLRKLASWVAEQGFEEKYFLKVHSERYEEKLPDFYGSASGMTLPRVRYLNFQSTHDLPWEVAQVDFRSEHKSLASYALVLAVLHSRTEVLLLWGHGPYKVSGWDQEEVDWEEVSWKHISLSWKTIVEEPTTLWVTAFKRTEHALRDTLESLVGEDAAGSEDAKKSDA